MRLKNHKIFLLRCLFFCFGLMSFAFGIAMTIQADFGASAWDAVSVGLHDIIPISVGTWMNMISILLIVMGAWIKKEFPKISCMITSIVLSGFVDVFLPMLQILQPSGWISKAIMFLIGVLFVSMGCGTYLVAQFPPCPIDYFMMAIKEGFHKSIRTAMTLCEVSGLVFALLTQGPIGIGTVLSVFIYGPLIQCFHVRATRLYHCLKRLVPEVVHNAVDI